MDSVGINFHSDFCKRQHEPGGLSSPQNGPNRGPPTVTSPVGPGLGRTPSVRPQSSPSPSALPPSLNNPFDMSPSPHQRVGSTRPGMQRAPSDPVPSPSPQGSRPALSSPMQQQFPPQHMLPRTAQHYENTQPLQQQPPIPQPQPQPQPAGQRYENISIGGIERVFFLVYKSRMHRH
jgi:hypothetical protein